MTARGKYISLAMILMFILSACISINTTVKIEPGFVGQKYKKVCVIANYEITATESTPEKYFCDELKRRGIKATPGQDILNYPDDYMDDKKIIEALKKKQIRRLPSYHA